MPARRQTRALARAETRHKRGLASSRRRYQRAEREGRRRAVTAGIGGAVGGVTGYGIGEWIEVADWNPFGVDGRWVIGIPAAVGGVVLVVIGLFPLGLTSLAFGFGMIASRTLRGPMARRGEANWLSYRERHGLPDNPDAGEAADDDDEPDDEEPAAVADDEDEEDEEEEYELTETEALEVEA